MHVHIKDHSSLCMYVISDLKIVSLKTLHHTFGLCCIPSNPFQTLVVLGIT